MQIEMEMDMRFNWNVVAAVRRSMGTATGEGGGRAGVGADGGTVPALRCPPAHLAQCRTQTHAFTVAGEGYGAEQIRAKAEAQS